MSQRAPFHRHKPELPANTEAEIAALVEPNRDRVRELEARGYLPSEIDSVSKPFKSQPVPKPLSSVTLADDSSSKPSNP